MCEHTAPRDCPEAGLLTKRRKERAAMKQCAKGIASPQQAQAGEALTESAKAGS